MRENLLSRQKFLERQEQSRKLRDLKKYGKKVCERFQGLQEVYIRPWGEALGPIRHNPRGHNEVEKPSLCMSLDPPAQTDNRLDVEVLGLG